ncbi:MAG: FHA domain-containing protein [Bdellovibrionales bacterium]|nr:FHA domain-containing protein [Bdellovibrionales bacterium]
MSKALILEEVGSSGIREIGRLDGGETVIGREPDKGLAIDHGAISREHGSFLRVRNHWFYKDLGSTNGSWINGNSLPQGIWQLVRPNDYIQLADLAVRLRSEEGGGISATLTGMPATNGRSLVIFSDGRFIDEFPIPEFGRALVVGGSQGDLDIRGDVYENPSLVVERRGDSVCAYNVAKEYELKVNGGSVEETSALKDRDIIELCEFTILFNDPPSVVSGAGAAAMGTSPQGTLTNLKDWGEEQAGPDLVGGVPTPTQQPVSTHFGRTFESQDETDLAETISMDPSQMSAAYGSTPGRYGQYPYEDPSQQYGRSSLEDKVIILLGVVLFLVLALLVVWYVLV